MDEKSHVQAALAGVSVGRFEVLKRLGVSDADFGVFSRYSEEMLEELVALELPAKELVEVVGRSGYGLHNVEIYAQLRRRGVAAVEINGVRKPADLLEGLKAGLELNIVRQALGADVYMPAFLEAHEAGIAFDEIFGLLAADKGSLSGYVEGRRKGFNHAELLAVAVENQRLTPGYRGFGIAEYLDVRAKGVTHEQVIQVLRDPNLDHSKRRYYHEFVHAEERVGLGHEQAYVLVQKGLYPGNYWSSVGELTYDRIVFLLELGVEGFELEKFDRFLRSNCRITFEEVVQYWQIEGSVNFANINSYIKLLDAGFAFQDIKDALDAGLRLYQYGKLRTGDLSLSQGEVLEVARSPIEVNTYQKLRADGVAHAVILEAFQLQETA